MLGRTLTLEDGGYGLEILSVLIQQWRGVGEDERYLNTELS